MLIKSYTFLGLASVFSLFIVSYSCKHHDANQISGAIGAACGNSSTIFNGAGVAAPITEHHGAADSGINCANIQKAATDCTANLVACLNPATGQPIPAATH